MHSIVSCSHGSRSKDDRDDHPRSEHNNNNSKPSLDVDKPLNLEIHHRVTGDERRHSSNTDKDSGSGTLARKLGSWGLIKRNKEIRDDVDDVGFLLVFSHQIC